MELISGPDTQHHLPRDASWRDVPSRKLHRHVRQASLDVQRRRFVLLLRPENIPLPRTDDRKVAGNGHLRNFGRLLRRWTPDLQAGGSKVDPLLG